MNARDLAVEGLLRDVLGYVVADRPVPALLQRVALRTLLNRAGIKVEALERSRLPLSGDARVAVDLKGVVEELGVDQTNLRKALEVMEQYGAERAIGRLR